jgi:ribonuclease HI
VVESVYSAVRTDSLYCIKQIKFRLLKVNLPEKPQVRSKDVFLMFEELAIDDTDLSVRKGKK